MQAPSTVNTSGKTCRQLYRFSWSGWNQHEHTWTGEQVTSSRTFARQNRSSSFRPIRRRQWNARIYLIHQKRGTNHRSTRRPMKMKWPGSGKDLPLIPRCNNLDKEKRMRLQKKGRTVFPRKRILTIRRTVLLTVTRMPGVTTDLLQVQKGIEGVTPGLQQVLDKKH